MFGKIEIFRMSNAMAVHAGTRQAAIAQNIANADTPGYQARDVLPFGETYENNTFGFHLRATRAGHSNNSKTAANPQIITRGSGAPSPNQNNVSLELEMLEAADVKRQHEQAISIYKSGLSILRTTIGRG